MESGPFCSSNGTEECCVRSQVRAFTLRLVDNRTYTFYVVGPDGRSTTPDALFAGLQDAIASARRLADCTARRVKRAGVKQVLVLRRVLHALGEGSWFPTNQS